MAAASRPEQPKPTCGARRRQGGDPCRKQAGWGTDHPGSGHCRLHCGSTPGGKVAALKERLRLVDPEPTTGVAAIQRALDGVNGLVTAIESELDALNARTVVSKGEVRAIVRIWRDGLRELATIGKLHHDAGIDERQVRVMERYGDAIGRLLEGVLHDLHLTAEQQRQAPMVVQRHLAALEGGRQVA